MAATPETKKSEEFFTEIRQMVFNFRKTRILFTAFELDIFTILDTGPMSAEEVATKIHSDPRSTNRLMNALVALRYLEKENGRFSNTVLNSRHLVKDKPGYFGGMMHNVHLFYSWNTLTQAVKSGKSVINQKEGHDKTQWIRAFIEAMHSRAQNQAPEVAKKLDLRHVKEVLDIGGGSGIFSMAMVNVNPNLHATVFDLPDVIPITKAFILKEGYNGKIRTIAGSFREKLPDDTYDLIFLSAIIHMNSFEQNEDLITKCNKVLNPGGSIVIQDYVMNDDRTSPEAGAIFALNMLVGTENGDTYTEAEIRAWFEHIGLINISRVDLSYGSSLMIGEKAG